VKQFVDRSTSVLSYFSVTSLTVCTEPQCEQNATLEMGTKTIYGGRPLYLGLKDSPINHPYLPTTTSAMSYPGGGKLSWLVPRAGSLSPAPATDRRPLNACVAMASLPSAATSGGTLLSGGSTAARFRPPQLPAPLVKCSIADGSVDSSSSSNILSPRRVQAARRRRR
jgi:hypothetical protein